MSLNSDRETIPNQYFQYRDLFPDRADLQNPEVTYQPYEDNVKDFFRVGTISNTSVNASGGNENTTYSLGFGHSNDESFLPGNSLIC